MIYLSPINPGRLWGLKDSMIAEWGLCEDLKEHHLKEF